MALNFDGFAKWFWSVITLGYSARAEAAVLRAEAEDLRAKNEKLRALVSDLTGELEQSKSALAKNQVEEDFTGALGLILELRAASPTNFKDRLQALVRHVKLSTAFDEADRYLVDDLVARSNRSQGAVDSRELVEALSAIESHVQKRRDAYASLRQPRIKPLEQPLTRPSTPSSIRFGT